MADQVLQGFGTAAPFVPNVAVIEFAYRIIVSNPGRIVRIRSVIPMVLKSTGAAPVSAYVAVMIARATSVNALPQSGIPFKPILGAFPGIWGDGDAPGYTKLYAKLVSVNAPTDNLAFGENDAVAQDGQILVVLCSAIIDATAVPVYSAGGAIGLTVLGDDVVASEGNGPAQFAIGGQRIGVGRSIPRFDIGE